VSGTTAGDRDPVGYALACGEKPQKFAKTSVQHAAGPVLYSSRRSPGRICSPLGGWLRPSLFWVALGGGDSSSPGTLIAMNWLKASMVAWALLMIGMGTEAFIAKGSTVSLIAGGGAGALMLVCVALTGSRPRIGYIGASVICLAIVGRFLPAYMKSGDPYPALLATVASIALFVALGLGHMLAVRKRRAESGMSV